MPPRFVAMLAVCAAAAVSGCALIHGHKLSVAGALTEARTAPRVDVAAHAQRVSWSFPLPAQLDRRETFGSLVVRIKDERRDYHALSVKSVEVQYVDGTSAPDNWSVEHDDVPFAAGQAEISIPNVFSRCGDATITVNGELRTSDGRSESFSERRDVKAESVWEFWTWIDWIASC